MPADPVLLVVLPELVRRDDGAVPPVGGGPVEDEVVVTERRGVLRTFCGDSEAMLVLRAGTDRACRPSTAGRRDGHERAERRNDP